MPQILAVFALVATMFNQDTVSTIWTWWVPLKFAKNPTRTCANHQGNDNSNYDDPGGKS